MATVQFTTSHSLDGLKRINDARDLCAAMGWEIDKVQYGPTRIDRQIRDIMFRFVNPDHATLFKLTWT